MNAKICVCIGKENICILNGKKRTGKESSQKNIEVRVEVYFFLYSNFRLCMGKYLTVKINFIHHPKLKSKVSLKVNYGQGLL